MILLLLLYYFIIYFVIAFFIIHSITFYAGIHITLTVSFYIYLFVCKYMLVNAYHGACLKVRGLLVGVGSVLLPCGSQS